MRSGLKVNDKTRVILVLTVIGTFLFMIEIQSARISRQNSVITDLHYRLTFLEMAKGLER